MKRPFPVVLAAAVLLTACGTAAPSAPAASGTVHPTASPTPVASPSVPATAAPTATPAPTQQPTAAPTAPPSPDLVMQVAVSDLVMRSAPGVGADSKILAPALAAPQLVFLFEGPVGADGYQWYRAVAFTPDATMETVGGKETMSVEDTRTGWIAAASRDGEPWIVPAQLTCPAPSFAVLASRANVASFACYGDQDITLDGSYESCAVVDPQLLEPFWLFPQCYLAVVTAAELSGPPETEFWMAVLPTLRADLGEGGSVRVVGHYDDPAAATCHYPPSSDEFPDLPDVAEAVLNCRATFVATEITYLGSSA